jgi:hypothetical protein
MQKQKRTIFQPAPWAPFLITAALRFKPETALRIPVPKPPRFELVQPRLAKSICC